MTFENAKILYIDLSQRSICVRELDSDTYKKYPGGSALGMYLMLKNMDPEVDPLSPENMLIFSVSPIVGYPISGQSRMCVTTKSPLTGTAGDSQVGGYIPAHVKANGYDSIVITGKASSPVYIYIDKEKVEIRDAKSMWGMTTDKAEKAIADDLGDDKTESSIIGPGGENLVKYASIMHRTSRANGRNGTGAVMGAKNLKALVVKRQQMPKAANPDGLKTLTKNVKERMASNPAVEGTALLGSAGVVNELGTEGFLPSYNWNTGTMDGWINTAGTTISETILKERETCHACAVRCKGAVEIPGKVDPKFGGPEYETLSTFGSYCGNANLEDICIASQLCNMYGIDTISCGATIAWAMDCYDKGILTLEDTDGIELNFGDGKVFESLIKKIAYREKGIGNLLADGSVLAAKSIGKAAEELTVATKAQEWPAHMPQMKPNLIINYAVNCFGADHQSAEHDTALMAPEDDQSWIWLNLLDKFDRIDSFGILDDNKAKFAFVTQKYYSMMDTLCLCQFVWGPTWQLYGPHDLISFCKYALDWDITIEELQEIGERRMNMMRMFNAKIGFDRKDDVAPKKAFLPITDADGNIHQLTEDGFEEAINSYYKYAGWDIKTGIPTDEALERLGLSWIKNSIN